MTKADETTDHRGEIRPSTDENEQLEDKITDEKDVEMAEESRLGERKSEK